MTAPAWIDPMNLRLYGPGVVAGIAIGLVCSVLSPLVVLKRLSFVGQGISHAAFGGIGIVALLGALGVLTGQAAAAAQYPIVLAFCLACALLIAWLIDRGASQADTAIGIVLVASMTLGGILIEWSARHGGPARSWESILFGSIMSVDATDAIVAWGVAAGILLVLWWFRRPLLFWAFDEAAAPAFGVPAQAMKYLLVVLLTMAIVTAMKLAGVVLATALLVLPGAVALSLSNRQARVLLLAVAVGLGGVIAGLAASFELDNLPPGACIVAVLVLIFAAARAGRAGRGLAKA